MLYPSDTSTTCHKCQDSHDVGGSSAAAPVNVAINIEARVYGVCIIPQYVAGTVQDRICAQGMDVEGSSVLIPTIRTTRTGPGTPVQVVMI